MAREIELVEGLPDDELAIRKKKVPAKKKGLTEDTLLKSVAASFSQLLAKKPLLALLAHASCSSLALRALRAWGATGLLLEDAAEATASLSFVDALVIHSGTLTRTQPDVMRGAVSQANLRTKPWVLNPAGVGALSLRTFFVREMMRRFPAVIVGSKAEIAFLAGNDDAAKREVAEKLRIADVAPLALRVANVTHAAVLLWDSEACYVACEGAPLVEIKGATTLSDRLEAFPCALSACVAALLGVLGGKARLESALTAAVAFMAVAEKMKKNAPVGSLEVNFLDALSMLTSESLVKNAHLSLIQL